MSNVLHDGKKMKLESSLSYRYGDPERDYNLNGDRVESNYIVIVRKKDCPIITDDYGRQYLDTKDAKQSVVLAYGGTYYGYTVWTKRTSKIGIYIDYELVYKYYQCTKYVVLNNKVYSASLRQKELTEYQLEKYENEKKFLRSIGRLR